MAYENQPSRDNEAGFKEAERRIAARSLAARMRMDGRGEHLDLSGLRLTNLPDSLWSLTSLQHLDLVGNQLTTLPESIGNLTGLQVLNLDHNQLTTLPESIGNLTGLQVLNLDHNQLSTLPETIGNLKALEWLDIQGNQLNGLPESIGNLNALLWLDLEGNQLSELPETIRNLRGLRGLRLEGNPGLGLLDNLSNSAEPKAILDHYFALRRQGGRALNEVRMVLVGRGGAGKTSLVQQLVKGTFDPRQPETPGVALSDWVMKDCTGQPVTAHLWDFAGQVITHTMHRYFLAQQTVYLLVLTQREDNAMEDADYWLKLIQSYGTEQNSEGQETGPPVLVILNKSDQARVKVDREALLERFPFILSFIETDCESGRGINTLREHLCDLMDDPKVKTWVRRDYPAQWWRVKDKLNEVQKQKPHLSYPDFKKVCRDCGVTDVDAVGRDLHLMGIALNYGLDPQWKAHLSDLTVLRPSWVTHHCYSLVRHAEKNSGVLYRTELPEVLAEEREGVPGEHDPTMHLYLMRLMERFEVAYPLEQDDSWPPMKWLVPLGLEDNQPKGVAHFSKVPPEAATRLRYLYPSVPPGLIAQFMVRTHPFEETHMHWASGTVLTLNGARALVRVMAKTEIQVTVIEGTKEARRELAGLCQDEIRSLNKQIQALDFKEVTEVVAEGQIAWANVKTLEQDEMRELKSSVETDQGTLPINNVKELNEFGAPDGRLPSRILRVGDGLLKMIGIDPSALDRPETGIKRFAAPKPKVFVSYSHTDERHLRQLHPRLKILRTLGLMEEHWYDRKIQPGMAWDKAIKTEIVDSDVIPFFGQHCIARE